MAPGCLEVEGAVGGARRGGNGQIISQPPAAGPVHSPTAAVPVPPSPRTIPRPAAAPAASLRRALSLVRIADRGPNRRSCCTAGRSAQDGNWHLARMVLPFAEGASHAENVPAVADAPAGRVEALAGLIDGSGENRAAIGASARVRGGSHSDIDPGATRRSSARRLEHLTCRKLKIIQNLQQSIQGTLPPQSRRKVRGGSRTGSHGTLRGGRSGRQPPPRQNDTMTRPAMFSYGHWLT
jgi:hypothetical protein